MKKKSNLRCILLSALFCAGGLVAAHPVVAQTVPDEPETYCDIDYNIVDDWGFGATVNVTVYNDNYIDVIDGWTVSWEFEGDQSISNMWSATFSQEGSVVEATNGDWNGLLQPNGGAATFGFNMSYSGDNAAPENFMVNGIPCFGYTPLVPNTPVVQSPQTGSFGAYFNFDWTDAQGAVAYRFQLSSSSSFSTLVIDETLTESNYALKSTVAGVYYWRVFAIGQSGDSGYSDIQVLMLTDYFADADGDSLLNGWELHGYDADDDGEIDIDLPALGASYVHKDLFVEMDYMVRTSAANGLGPNQNVLDGIVDVFANAPVSNPDGIDGITIHLELDEQVPHDADLNPVGSEFGALMNTHFDPVRTGIYFYMIWADAYDGGSSSGNAFNIPNSYFVVTLGKWNNNNGGTDAEKTGLFIHEFGHDLGLGHGGGDHENDKPNYLSVMNYMYTTEGVFRDGTSGHFDYQRFDIPSLDERNLDEGFGLGGGAELAGYRTYFNCPNGSRVFTPVDGAIDWNCDGDTFDAYVSSNIGGNGGLSVLNSYNDWANLVYGGGLVRGGTNTSKSLSIETAQEVDTLQIIEMEEMTYEEHLARQR
ncbi:MAG: cellulose-binding domain-containing protein [Deltaproteobacteria bacterium]|nr:cellulose-binding domain-containing protein [Deltaproteobacteria bacterium]